MSKAGEWEISVKSDVGGWPIWIEIHYRGQSIAKLVDALELPDLEYAVSRARVEAKARDKDIRL